VLYQLSYAPGLRRHGTAGYRGTPFRIRAAPLIFLLVVVFFLLWLMDDLGPGW